MLYSEENIKIWIAALRSGDYPQARGALQRVQMSEVGPAGYCCLGVGAVVARKEWGVELPTYGSEYADVGLQGRLRGLSLMEGYGAVKEAYGIKSDAGDVLITKDNYMALRDGMADPEKMDTVWQMSCVKGHRGANVHTTVTGIRVSLTDLNDVHGFTFEDIAHVLENSVFVSTYHPRCWYDDEGTANG